MTDTKTTTLEDLAAEINYWRDPTKSAELSAPTDWSDAVGLIRTRTADLLWRDLNGGWHAFRLRPEYENHRESVRVITQEFYKPTFARSRA